MLQTIFFGRMMLARNRNISFCPRVRGLCHAVTVILFLATPLGLSSCSTSDYLLSRARDAGDIVSASVGVGLGGKVRMGPAHIGLLVQMDTCGWRTFFLFTPPSVLFFDADWTIGSVEQGGWSSYRNKGFSAVGGNAQDFLNDDRCDSWAIGWPMLVALDKDKDKGMSADTESMLFHPYYSECEVCFGLIGTIRLGVNPGELVDFFLGWFGVDFFDDDHPYLDAEDAQE